MIQLTKPVLVALAAGVIAVSAIAVAAWRLSSVSEAPPPVVERPVGGQSVAPTPSAPKQSAEPTNASPSSGAPDAVAALSLQGPIANTAPSGSPLGELIAPSGPPSDALTSPSSSHKPSFDVVRIDPTGDAVIAGRAAPGVQVALMLSGKPVAQAQADANGQFVMLPPKLPPGDHVLALRATGADGDILSEQTVSIAVPERGGQEAVAALAAPNKPTVVLSQPAAPAGAGFELRIVSVEALQGGSMFASGLAPPGANLRLYLNEAFIASVEAGADGKWSIRVQRGLSAGSYRVRADRVGADGRAVARVEAPFDYPAALARQFAAARARTPAGNVATSNVQQNVPTAGPAVDAPGSAQPGAGAGSKPGQPGSPVGPERSGDAQNAVVAELLTARVERGDSLWRISATIYGEGTRYTQIYDANASQIRDPDLIYPGQVLVVPKQDAPKSAVPGERRR
ncbi:MAG: LysM peptidoglycan-binding domain-containing protein [Beijerinckiaceae bacterium]|nr:LysM peptidoglycan-binding domain-containing protein [Beijerinckiaceae bacterium]